MKKPTTKHTPTPPLIKNKQRNNHHTPPPLKLTLKTPMPSKLLFYHRNHFAQSLNMIIV